MPTDLTPARTPDQTAEAQRSDRRLHPRVGLDVLANRFLEGHPYLCRAIDISREGLRIARFNEPMKPLAPRFVGLQFQLPGSSEILTASGEVVFNDEGSRAVGLRFTHLGASAAAAIDDFVARRTPRS